MVKEVGSSGYADAGEELLHFLENVNIGDWIQLGIFLIYAIILIVMIKQLKTMQHQNVESINFYKNQNLFVIIKLLQDEKVRAAREIIYTLEGKPFTIWGSWDDQERRAASTVCTSYNLVGIFLKNKSVPSDIIIKNWAHTIIRCYNVLLPFIKHMRDERFKNQNYWSEFEWLYNEARKSLKEN